ncbi:hypothetical protein WME79_19580 [Sorangium sp. So ce726]|uniref:hypothetical protein n=1 Tax=Sorangium sp. So ce726 TaxID=3133319 RepID=UPI003F5DBA77
MLAISLVALFGFQGGCTPPGDVTGDLDLEVPRDALDGPSPGGLHPHISSESGLIDPILSKSPGNEPAVACGDEVCLVAWRDDRDRRSRIYGARVALDGTVLDPLGIPLLAAGYPAVAAQGDGFLVVGVGAAEDGSGAQVRGARVSAAGAVLDPGGFALSPPSPRIFGGPAIAFDGTSHLVAWVRRSGAGMCDGVIEATRVSTAGVVLDPPGTIALSTTVWGHVHLASGGASSLLAWVECPGEGLARVRGARVSPEGALLDAAGFAISPTYPFNNTSWLPSAALAFDGTNYAVAWHRWDDGSLSQLEAARVTPAGAVLDPGGLTVATLPPYVSTNRLAAAFDGAATVLAWDTFPTDDPDFPTETARVSPAGGVITPPAPALSTGLNIAMASSEAGVLAAWVNLGAGTTHVAGARLSALGASLDGPAGFPISKHADEQRVRAAASDGENLLVLWSDDRDELSGDPGLIAARVTPTGAVLDPTGIPIANEPGGIARAVFDGSSFLAVWWSPDASALRAARVSPSGVVLDARPFDLPLYFEGIPYGMAAASNGEGTLVVAPDESLGTGFLRAVLVDQAGAVTPQPEPLSFPSFNRVWVDAIAGGSGYLVVWHDGSTLWGQRLDGGAAPIDAEPFIVAVNPDSSSSPESAMRGLSVGFDGGGFLVVWEQGAWLHGARVSPDGTILDPDGFPIAPVDIGAASWPNCEWSAAGPGCPALAFDGQRFVLAWKSRSVPGDDGSLELFGAELSSEGAVLSTFPLSTEPGVEGPAVLASAGDSKTLLAYTRFLPEAPFSAGRARVRLLDSSASDEGGAGAGGEGGAGAGGAGAGGGGSGGGTGAGGSGSGGGATSGSSSSASSSSGSGAGAGSSGSGGGATSGSSSSASSSSASSSSGSGAGAGSSGSGGGGGSSGGGCQMAAASSVATPAFLLVLAGLFLQRRRRPRRVG